MVTIPPADVRPASPARAASRLRRTALLLATAALGALLTPPLAPAPASAQVTPPLPEGVQMEVNIRPTRVRVGDRVLLTLQLRVPTTRALTVEELVEVEGVTVGNVSDRSSVAVGAGGRAMTVREVVWTLDPSFPGSLELHPLRIWVDDTAHDHPVPAVEVLDAPLRRALAPPAARTPRPGRDEPPVLPQGRVPPTGGEAAAVIPGGRPAGTGVVVTVPGGIQSPAGQRPPGPVVPGRSPGGLTTGSVAPSDGWSSGVPGGWAESAHQDPYWEELVPRVESWASVARDPTGWVELSAGVAPPTVYVGQQLTYLAAAGFAAEAGYRMQRDPEYFAPSPADVWRVDVARLGPGYLGASQGELQEVRPFVQAFFPLRPGTLTIPSARMTYSLWGSGRFGPGDTLATEPVAVEVLPIPAGDAPPGWDGAVGRYTLGISLDRERLLPGETAVLTLTVRGAGNVEALSAPRPTNLRGVVLRPLGERAVVEARDGVVGGVKVFQWLVSVAEPGLLSLGPFLLPHFDPWAGAFQVAATREVTLEGIGG